MLKILFITHEVSPFSCLGMAGEIAESLTRALKKNGHEVRIVTPRYRCIRERKHGLRDVARLHEMSITFGGQVYPASVKSGFVPHSKVQVYFVENDHLFPVFPSDDCTTEESLLRALFLSHAALQLIAHLNWIPDAIYCCGWRTAATPYLLKHHPQYLLTEPGVKTVMHCCAKSGNHSLTAEDFARFDLEPPPSGSELTPLLQLGLQSADVVIKSGDDEVGVAGALMKSLCQTDPAWDPRTDPHLSQNYGAADFTVGKAANKTAVQGKYGLAPTAESLLVALWGKEAEGDSGALIRQLAAAFPDLDLQFVAVGGAAKSAHSSNIPLDDSLRGRVAVLNGVSESELRMIEAGSDVSLHTAGHSAAGFRPLSSLLYGSAPIMPKRESGAISAEEFDILTSRGTGFGFDADDSSSMIEALRLASETYRDKAAWNELMRLGMDRDYYWEQAARYITLKLKKSSALESGV